jgi:hypothetical protein
MFICHGVIRVGNRAPAEYFSPHGGVSSRQCEDEVWSRRMRRTVPARMSAAKSQ